MIKNVLFSVSLHGILIACCLAMPAQKLVPLFQAGNSALTLTSLSVSTPAEERSKNIPARKQSVDNESELEMESDETDSPDDLTVIPDKKPPPPVARKQPNQKTPLDADAQTKGISAGLTGRSGIRPYYPLGARLRGEEGIVKVEAWVGVNGRVLNCAVIKSSGYSALDDAALVAVKRTRFISAKALPIQNKSKTVLTFRFDLVD